MNKIKDFFDAVRPFFPKAHTVIANKVIAGGFLLAAGPTIFQQLLIYFGVSLYENIYDVSPGLTGFLSSDASIYAGALIITLGLIYHFLCERIDRIYAIIPEKPKIDIGMTGYLGCDVSPEHQVRGILFGKVMDDIPDYEDAEHNAVNDVLGFNFYRSTWDQANKNYYREFHKLIFYWGGMEFFSIRIKNEGSKSISNAKMIYQIESCDGSFLSFNQTPSEPSIKNTDHFHDHYLNRASSPYTLNALDDGQYTGDRETGEILAGDTHEFGFTLCIKPRSETVLKINILADGLSEPIEKVYKFFPTPEEKQLQITDITCKEARQKLLNEGIMPGYFEARFEEVIRFYEKMEKSD